MRYGGSVIFFCLFILFLRETRKFIKKDSVFILNITFAIENVSF